MTDAPPYVLVPATPAGLHPTAVPALLAAGFTVHVAPMPDELAYYRTLAGAWVLAERADWPLLVVEHDVEASPAVTHGLLACPLPWCVAPYNSHEALGCAKFVPAALGGWPLHDPVPWLALDHAVYRALMDGAGVGPHVHARPRPVHHHGQ